MTYRFKRCVAAAALAVSVVGGGSMIASNTHMIASTADAGLPSPLPSPAPTVPPIVPPEGWSCETTPSGTTCGTFVGRQQEQ